MKSFIRSLLDSAEGTWLLALSALIAGIYLLLIGAYCVVKGRRSRHWPTIEGLVERLALYEAGHGRRLAYETRLSYVYALHGVHYRCSRVFWGDRTFLSTGEANLQERIAEDYPEGAAVTVHYNPARPAEAVLETGAPFRMYVTVFAGLLLLGLSAWFAVLASDT